MNDASRRSREASKVFNRIRRCGQSDSRELIEESEAIAFSRMFSRPRSSSAGVRVRA